MTPDDARMWLVLARGLHTLARTISSAAQMPPEAEPIAVTRERTAAPAPVGSAKPPSARQVQILIFIRDYIATNGMSPTLREIGAAVGIVSTNGVNDHLVALERRGFISTRPGLSRSIRVLKIPDTEEQKDAAQ